MATTVDDGVKVYKRFYPEYTEASLRKAIVAILRKGHRLASPTVNHYMSPKRFGGLGYGKRKRGK